VYETAALGKSCQNSLTVN